MTIEELFALRDAMIERVGPSPDAWYEDLGVNGDAVLAVAQDVAAIAEELRRDAYSAAGTSFCMGFALGALYARETERAASS